MQRLSHIAFLLVSLVGFELIGLAQSSTITTYAGIGQWPVSGTQAITQPIDGPPLAAQLRNPSDMALDGAGNLFLADSLNKGIRKMTSLMGPVVFMDSAEYRVGDSWSVKVTFGAPNTPARLLGTSNTLPWEVPGWNTTDGSGSFTVNGRFAEGTAGIHTLQVELGGVFSNTITFRVSN